MSRLSTSLLAVCVLSCSASAEPRTRVTINGTDTPVYFNDGDSFKVLDKTRTRARLKGFNTLESYGPVHRWGDWTFKELLVIAKLGTLNGRVGTWTCTSSHHRDTYGRSLFDCPGLAEDQIRKGLAHAMTVTAEPSAPRLLEAQRDAQDARRGMWAHGDPEWILTSLHSLAEDPTRPTSYNRVVSTVDGHSEMWRHTERYRECQEVCVENVTLSEETVAACDAALSDHPAVGSIWKSLSPAHRRLTLRVFSMLDSVAAIISTKNDKKAMARALGELRRDGTLVEETRQVASCNIYVDFKRRFGGGRAACLR